MSNTELRSEILKLVQLIEDESFLQAIRVLLIKQIPNADSKDFWDELPIQLQEDIKTALMEADRGKLLSHEVVMQEMR